MLDDCLADNSWINTNFCTFDVVFDFFFFFFFPSEASEPDKYRFKYSSFDIAIFEEYDWDFLYNCGPTTHVGEQSFTQNIRNENFETETHFMSFMAVKLSVS